MSTYYYATLEPVEKPNPGELDEVLTAGDLYRFQVMGKDKEGRPIVYVIERW